MYKIPNTWSEKISGICGTNWSSTAKPSKIKQMVYRKKRKNQGVISSSSKLSFKISGICKTQNRSNKAKPLKLHKWYRKRKEKKNQWIYIIVFQTHLFKCNIISKLYM